jgi:hypothetical protein
MAGGLCCENVDKRLDLCRDIADADSVDYPLRRLESVSDKY